MGHRSKEKSEKKNPEEQIKTERKKVSAPASLRQRNSSWGLTGKQLLSFVKAVSVSSSD